MNSMKPAVHATTMTSVEHCSILRLHAPDLGGDEGDRFANDTCSCQDRPAKDPLPL